MAVPIEIEGRTYYGSMPTLRDWMNFNDLLRKESRKEAYAAIPEGLSEDEINKWIDRIDRKVDSINPHTTESLDKLLILPGGQVMYYHALLRRDNPNVTLQWVQDLVERARDNDKSALQGIRNMNGAIAGIYLEARKNSENGKPRASPKRNRNRLSKKR
jgi:hypothetical protein